jgi:metal-responsive CopG/Arc/MetJ family transcriptional regulator
MLSKNAILISFDKSVKEKLEEYSKESLVSKSALINKLVKDYLEKNFKKNNTN